MTDNSIFDKNGYLDDNFRLFHLRDTTFQTADYHYHDFDKIVFFISGQAEYIIEGITYPLRPMDMLFVGQHKIHKSTAYPPEPYERIIIYIDPGFSRRYGTEKTSLTECFKVSARRGLYLLRPDSRRGASISELIFRLEQAISSDEFASDVLARTMFIQLMVFLNRLSLEIPSQAALHAARHDPRISEVMSYISDNLTSDLSVDSLAARCYLSRYHFMRRFREMTGGTVHGYIRKKRLLYASSLIKDGMPALQAASLSGFGDYSTFIRAFRQEFGALPSSFTGNGIADTPVQE